jgi:microcystin-dependent protein
MNAVVDKALTTRAATTRSLTSPTSGLDPTRMRRLDEQFAISPNDPVLPTWRRAMAAIEGRLRDLEAQRADYEAAIRRFEELALARINEVLLPALEQITAAATLGFLLVRSSTEGALIADGRIQFLIDEGPQRDLFTPTPFVAVQRQSTTDDFAVGYVEAFDRPTGYLLVKILNAYGSPGPFDDWVITAAPGVSEATRSYWERALVAAQASERDAAQTAEDRRYVEAAREALEEAGLNPDQYVWRDGTRPFTAVIRGVTPDATVDDVTMPTAFWTRRRVQEGVATLQAGAPAALNTFVRVATALGNDPNFAATLRRELNVMAVPIGGIIGWPDDTWPANFMLCDGAIYNVVDAPLLAAKMRARHGGDGLATFGVPNLVDRTIVGAGHSWGLAAVGGAINHILSEHEMPHHAHGVHDPQHLHGLGDPSHGHPFHDPAHGHGDGPHGHTQSRRALGGGVNLQPGAGFTLHDELVATHAAHASVHAGGTGAWIGASGTGQNVHHHPSQIAIHGAGGNGAHNNMPPFMALFFIIRFE